GAVINPPAPTAPTKPEPTVEERTDDPEETALSIVELIEDSTEPDTVIEKVLELLLTGKKISNPAKRAAQAALIVLKRAASPAPPTVAAALTPAAPAAPAAAVA